MIKLLKELRDLHPECLLYDFYEHSTQVMTIVSQHTNREIVVMAALIHEVREHKNEKEWLEFIHPHCKDEYDIKIVNRIVEELTYKLHQKEHDNIYDFHYHIIKNGSPEAEKITLANVLSELRLCKSNVLKNEYRKMFVKLAKNDTLPVDKIVEEILFILEISHNGATNVN